VRKKRPFIGLLLCLLVPAVASASTGRKELMNRISRFEERLQKAHAAQGPICAPEALAAAQACLADTKEEYEEGDYWEAEDLLLECQTRAAGLWERILECEKDQDLDGVPNRLDGCPGDPETYNGYKDEDGCPDLIPERAMLTHGKIEILEPVRFDGTTQEPLRASGTVLEDVARILKENPGLRIRIEVHLDNSLPAEEALNVSNQRAENVRRVLASLGIDASRMASEGKGGNEPVASNEASFGRQLNQRVEFVRLP